MARVMDDGGVRHVLPSGREITLSPGVRPGRSRSWRPWALVIAVIAAVDLIALATVGSGEKQHDAAGAVTTTAQKPLATTSPASSAASDPSGPPTTAAGSTSVTLGGAGVAACAIEAGSIVPPASGVCLWAGGARPASAEGTTTLLAANDLGLRKGELVRLDGRTWKINRVTRRSHAEGADPKAFAGKDGARQLYVVTSGATSDSYARAVPVG